MLQKELQKAVEWPIKRAAAYGRLGIAPVRGVLLHGPPGCSKTTLAKAAAHASQASFFSLRFVIEQCYILIQIMAHSMRRTEKFIPQCLKQTSIMHWFSAVELISGIQKSAKSKKNKNKCTFKFAPQCSLGSSHILLSQWRRIILKVCWRR